MALMFLKQKLVEVENTSQLLTTFGTEEQVLVCKGHNDEVEVRVTVRS